MAEDVRIGSSKKLPYLPALDGLRGCAVMAVLLFHGGYRWASGGFLGVTVFFVLSGFLITGLLLVEKGGDGRVDLRDFWLRRARRLAPAVVVLLVIVLTYSAFALTRPPRGLLGDVGASLAWVANWRFIFAHRSYADIFSVPSPLQHMWSLAVEEQFYLVLPLLVAAVLGTHRKSWKRRGSMAGIVLAGIAASTIAAAVLYSPNSSTARAYYGTDARAAEPLVGVLLAIILVSPAGIRRLRRVPTRLVGGAGLLCLVTLGYLMGHLTEHGQSLFRGGLLLAALLSAGVIAAAAQPRTIISRALACPPLVALGKISYGVYLFHWPLFLWLTSRRTGLTGNRLFAARCAVTVTVAIASYVLIEQPIRTRRMSGALAAISWADISIAALAGVGILSYSATPSLGGLSSGSTVAGAVRASAPVLVGPGLAPASVSAKAVAPRATGGTPTAGAAAVQTPKGPVLKKANVDAPPAGGFAPTPVPPIPTVRPGPNGQMPLKVAIVGDSMALNLGDGLSGWSADRTDIVTYNLAIRACPISRGGIRRLGDGETFPFPPDCNWWAQPDSERYGAFRQFNPDVVVLQDGMNEMVDRKLPSWSSYEHPGETQFDSWLLNEYSAAINVFKAKGAAVLALNAVCADFEVAPYVTPGEGPSRVAAMGRLDDALGGQGAQPVDYESHLCPNGKFTDTVDGVSDARPDGFHLSDEATVAVAQRWLGPMLLNRPRTPPVVAP